MLARYADPGSAFQSLDPGAGTAVMITVLIVAVAHLRLQLRPTYRRNSRVLLVFSVIFSQLLLLKGVAFMIELNHLEPDYLLYFAPVAFAPMLLTLLLGREHGIFAVIYGTLLGTLLVDAHACFHFAVLSALAGITGVGATRHLRNRSQLMRAGVYTGVCGVVLGLLLGWMEQVWLNPMNVFAWRSFGVQCVLALLTGMFTATLVGGLLPVLEYLFRITTTISWIELADLNHPLLRRMTMEAPGTYHHSLMVANLSEAAAEAIGADPTICRVCSYFHDIGKLNKPEYYIENTNGEDNPHDDLTPTMSALVVMAHVKDGVDLALKHKLNRRIIDVIQQHHGTSLAYYFYRRALDQQEEIKRQVAEGKAAPEDVPEVRESSFRYPGPKPDTRESAIISLADAVESAGRSLSKPTPAKIEQMVDEIIRGRVRDGQLDECDLTTRDLKLIADSFAKMLRTSLHRRVPYPEEKRNDETKTERRETREWERERDRATLRQPVAAKQSPA